MGEKMKSKKSLILIFIIIISGVLISSSTIFFVTTFGSGNNGTINFDISGNSTINISINKLANINYTTMTLVGGLGLYDAENDTESSNSSEYITFVNQDYALDENFSTCANLTVGFPSPSGRFYENITLTGATPDSVNVSLNTTWSPLENGTTGDAHGFEIDCYNYSGSSEIELYQYDNHELWISNLYIDIPTDCVNNQGIVSLDFIVPMGISNLQYCESKLDGIGITMEYPKNTSFILNNTLIWNNSDEFNSSSVITGFEDELNIALNGGACDCVGCELIDSNCSINLSIGSASAGVINYTDLGIWYKLPNINIVIPEENFIYGYNESLNLSFNYENFTTSNCLYNVQNSTGSFIISNTTISDCGNTTFNISTGSDDYTLNLMLNDTNGVIDSDSVNFSLSLEYPAVNLNYPTNNLYFNNGLEIPFNFTATDTDGFDSCILYGDFNGTWGANYTFSSVTSGVMESTSLNLSEGVFKWNVWCNDTVGLGSFALANYTTGLDTTPPIVNITSITNTNLNIVVNSTENDTNLDYCEFDLDNSLGGDINSGTFTCNTLLSTSVPSYGNYQINITAYDYAGNVGYVTNNFSVEASGTIISGGGGGSTVIISGNPTWIMEAGSGGASYTISLPLGAVKSMYLTFENIGDSSKEITLSCENLEGDLCKYVTFDNEKFTLPLIKDQKTRGNFELFVPEDYQDGEYSFNIIAIDNLGKKGAITVYVSIGSNPLIEAFSKLGLKTKGGIPYILIYLGSFIIILIFGTRFQGGKKSTAGNFLTVLASIILPLIIVYLI